MKLPRFKFRAIWVAVAAVCTAAFLYLFVSCCQMLSGLGDILSNNGAGEVEQFFVDSVKESIRNESIVLSLIIILYASFATLATEKLIALFRRPKSDIGKEMGEMSFEARKHILRALWLVLGIVCTAIFLYFLIMMSNAIHFDIQEIPILESVESGRGAADFLRKNIAQNSVHLLLITAIYASFVTLAVEKLIALFRHPKVENGEDIPRL